MKKKVLSFFLVIAMSLSMFAVAMNATAADDAKNALAVSLPLFRHYSEQIVAPENQANTNLLAYRNELLNADALVKGSMQAESAYTEMRSSLQTKWFSLRTELNISIGLMVSMDALYKKAFVNKSSYTPISWEAFETVYALKTDAFLYSATDVQCSALYSQFLTSFNNLSSVTDNATLEAKALLSNNMSYYTAWDSKIVLPDNQKNVNVLAYRSEIQKARDLLAGSIQSADMYISMNASVQSKWFALRTELNMSIGLMAKMDTLYKEALANKSLYTPNSWEAFEKTYALKTDILINNGTDAQCSAVYSQFLTSFNNLSSSADPTAMAARLLLVNNMNYYSAWDSKIILSENQKNINVVSYRTEIKNARALLAGAVQSADVYTSMNASLQSKWLTLRDDINISIGLMSKMDSVYNKTVVNKSYYTSDSWAAFEKAYALKTNLLINSGTDADCTKVYSDFLLSFNNLSSAINPAVMEAKSVLGSKINYYNSCDANIVLPENQSNNTVIAFRKALQTAKILLSGEISTVAAYKAADMALLDTWTGVRIALNMGFQFPIAMKSIYNQIQGSDILYTSESWANVATAYANLDFYANSANDSVCKQRLTLLQTAVNNLVLLPVYDVTFSVNGGADVSATKGKNVALNFEVPANSSLAGCLFEITYDTNNLTFVNATGTGFFEINSTVDGRLLIGFISADSLAAATTLFTLNFTVNANAPSVSTSLIVEVKEAFDGNNTNLTNDFQIGSILIG